MNRYLKLISILVLVASCGNENTSEKKAKVKEAPISTEDQLLWVDAQKAY